MTLRWSVSSDETSKNLLFGRTSGQIVSRRVVCCTVVGRPFTHLYPSGSLVLKMWNRVVPIRSSVSKTSFSTFQKSFGVSSEALWMPHDIDVFGEGGFIRDVQLDRCTSWLSPVKLPLMLRKCFPSSSSKDVYSTSSFFFHLARGFPPPPAFRDGEVEEGRRI